MKKFNWIFAGILLIAILLRIFRLDSVPPALFGDEVDVGYQAYSLLKTGKDLTGRPLPFYIKSLSEYRTPLYIYSAIPFVGVFGLNEIGTRLPAVFWGFISIIGIYFLTKKLFDKNIALIAMFITSISPWHLQFSRASFEVTMQLSFIVFGSYFLFLGLTKQSFFIPAAALLISSIYIYSTSIVFAPLLILLFLFINWKESRKTKIKTVFFVFITVAVILMPLGFSLITGEAKERFNTISIFKNSVLIDKLNLARKGQEFYDSDGIKQKTNPYIEAIFHNRPMVFGQVFIKNYLLSLSPVFLFADGDINFRHSIHEMGQEHYFVLILLMLGIFAVLKGDKKRACFVLGWLILAPIPAGLTEEGGFHATRLFIMIPAISILSAVGAYWIWGNKRFLAAKALIALIAILFIFNLTFYLHRYYYHYPVESWRWWHYGFKEAMEYMESVDQNYSKVGFNNTYEPSLIRFLFWNQISPADFQQNFSQTLLTEEIAPGFIGFKLKDKYYFRNDKNNKPVLEVIPSGMLYMVSARDEVEGDWDWSKNPPDSMEVLKTIRNPLNEPIFYVVAKK